MFWVNTDGMVLQNPETSAADQYNKLKCASYMLIGVVTGKRLFSIAVHIWSVIKGVTVWIKIGTSRMVQNSGESFETKVFLRKAFFSLPSKRVPG